jgi:DNA-binding NarL/FixJ family response regulator
LGWIWERSFKKPTRELIVDDHPMLREGLAQLINREKNLGVAGQAETAAMAVENSASSNQTSASSTFTLPGPAAWN